MVQLRDGKKLIGVLRSWDQFGNLVLQNTILRHFSQGLYGDEPRGLQLIRGENILLMGEIVRFSSPPCHIPLQTNQIFHASTPSVRVKSGGVLFIDIYTNQAVLRTGPRQRRRHTTTLESSELGRSSHVGEARGCGTEGGRWACGEAVTGLGF